MSQLLELLNVNGEPLFRNSAQLAKAIAALSDGSNYSNVGNVASLLSQCGNGLKSFPERLRQGVIAATHQQLQERSIDDLSVIDGITEFMDGLKRSSTEKPTSTPSSPLKLRTTIQLIVAQNDIRLVSSTEAPCPESVLLDLPIEVLNFSRRVYRGLKRTNFHRVAHLTYTTMSELITMKGGGMTCAKEVRGKLAELGLTTRPCETDSQIIF